MIRHDSLPANQTLQTQVLHKIFANSNRYQQDGKGVGGWKRGGTGHAKSQTCEKFATGPCRPHNDERKTKSAISMQIFADCFIFLKVESDSQKPQPIGSSSRNDEALFLRRVIINFGIQKKYPKYCENTTLRTFFIINFTILNSRPLSVKTCLLIWTVLLRPGHNWITKYESF